MKRLAVFLILILFSTSVFANDKDGSRPPLREPTPPGSTPIDDSPAGPTPISPTKPGNSFIPKTIESYSPPPMRNISNQPKAFIPPSETRMYSSKNHNSSVSNQGDAHTFRGTRRVIENGPVTLERSIVKTEKNGSTYVELNFSSSIDPRSFTADSVTINGVPIENGNQVMFNTNGTLCRIYVKNIKFPAEIKLLKIKSYCGDIVQPVKAIVNGDIHGKDFNR